MFIETYDEVTGQPPLPVAGLMWPIKTLTVRDLIRFRIESDAEQESWFAPSHWIRMSEHEAVLRGNAKEAEQRRELIERAVAAACTAYQQGGFFIIGDERQLGELDEEVALANVRTLTFLRLVPLKGG